jgi:outer membrane biosynthesis protein TonB
MTKEAWLKSQERKRTFISLSVTLGAYLLAFLAVWVTGLFKVENLSEYSGPLQIKLGAAQGVDESVFSYATQESQSQEAAAEAPVEEPPAENVEKARIEEEDLISEKTIAMEASPSAKPTATPKPSTKPSPKASAKPTAKPSAKPSLKPSPVVAVAVKPETSPAASPLSSPSSASNPGAQSSDKTVVVKGSEQGNAYETNLDAGSTVVGRGLYVPIYLYLPLPYDVDASVYNAIPKSADGFNSADERKTFFKKYYKESDGAWRLKAPVPLDDRPGLWITLSDAGYKVSKADYKEGKYLRNVVIKFKVSSGAGNSIPTLESVVVEKSSGYSDIDDAVLYGFRKAAFYNNGEKSVTGRFTYSFD